jgi:hypothetical protein
MDQPQPVRADRFQMRALVDDRDRLSGQREPDGDHAADRTRAYHYDSHKVRGIFISALL